MDDMEFNVEEFLEMLDRHKKTGVIPGNYAEITDHKRFEEYRLAIAVAEAVAKKSKVKVIPHYDKVSGLAGIKLSGKCFCIKSDLSNTDFLKIVSLADNMDVYPMQNGTVTVDFAFYGITKTIDLEA